MDDIDTAVAYRRDQLCTLRPRSRDSCVYVTIPPLTRPIELGSTPEGISTEYHFRLAHFCLSTHLILRVTASNIDPSALQIVRRCVDLAMDVLNLSHNVGPIGKEAFRFQPGFVCVSISFCVSFVLQAVQAFPDQFPNTHFMFMVIKRLCTMMTDTAVDQTHDSGAAGRANMRKLRITMEALRNRRLREEERIAVRQSRKPSMAPVVTERPSAPPSELESHDQPWSQHVPGTGSAESFSHGIMDDYGGFEYDQLVLDPAFNFPDFFNYAPQIVS